MPKKPSSNVVLICGPTASGKSALALEIARRVGAVIVNADALQVYGCWSVLTACPSSVDLDAAPHRLYRHVDAEAAYSVGHWLRDVEDLMRDNRQPLVFVGGTGLYMTGLTNGLASIPAIPPDIRGAGDQMRRETGCAGFLEVLQRDDPETFARIDRNNPMRLQRAWEVLAATGRPISDWHRNASEPLVNAQEALRLHVTCPADTLNARIDARLEAMVEAGALAECAAALARGWSPDLPSSKALGAPELVAHLNGEISLAEAVERAQIATHQFAKRQRTWFRSKMKDWQDVPAATSHEATISNISQRLKGLS